MKKRRYRVADVCKDKKGFTLVELILTIAILAVVTMPILNYFTDSAKHNAKSRQKQNATVAAQEVLENFKNASYSLDDPAVVCSAEPDWTVASAPDADGVYTLTKDETVDKSPFKITAKIKPVKAVDKSASSPAPTTSSDYKKYVIGTMDSTKDVMVSEHGQTLEAAGLAFLNKYNAACAGASPAKVPDSSITADWFKNKMDCAIIISAKQDSDPSKKEDYDIITVTYKYTYAGAQVDLGLTAAELPVTDLKYEDIVESTSIRVDKLENIYLFYTALTADDKICLETDDADAIRNKAHDLNLFVIAQSSVKYGTAPDKTPTGYVARPQNYKLTFDATRGPGFQDKIANVYLNLETSEFDSTGTIGSKAKTTLVHSESVNRIAEITVTVDSKDGSTTGIVEVSGSKVQN